MQRVGLINSSFSLDLEDGLVATRRLKSNMWGIRVAHIIFSLLWLFVVLASLAPLTVPVLFQTDQEADASSILSRPSPTTHRASLILSILASVDTFLLVVLAGRLFFLVFSLTKEGRFALLNPGAFSAEDFSSARRSIVPKCVQSDFYYLEWLQLLLACGMLAAVLFSTGFPNEVFIFAGIAMGLWALQVVSAHALIFLVMNRISELMAAGIW